MRNNLTATLLLNNKGALPLSVTPTFYSLNGTRLQLAPITVGEASYQEIDIREMLDGANAEFREGSLQITYQGKRLQLGSQIKLVDEDNSLMWDEQIFEPSEKFVSSRLESVWWMPSNNCETKFVISNTTDAPVTATMTVDGTSPNQQTPAVIQLNAHETRVLDVIRDVVGRNNGTLHETGGISISHTGSAGAVLARMLISKANKGFSSTMNFVDPQLTASSKWHGAGLRIGKINNQKLQPILAARNIGNRRTTVSGKIFFTNSNEEIVSITIPPTNVAANSTKTINLKGAINAANVPSNVKYAGIETEYTTERGSVIMSAVSVSPDDNHVFQVPLFDPEKTGTSAGGYPWKTDGDYTTVVYIKNETDAPKKYTVDLAYQGGGYGLGVRQIKAHETVAIDFRALRDAQTPDARGNIIPLNIEQGQIGWSIVGSENRTLTGRSEQVSVAKGISSTYDCRNCCPNSIFDGEVTPFEVESPVGGFVNFEGSQRDVNCYGQIFSPHPADDIFWESSNELIASTSSISGQTTAISPGVAEIQASWTGQLWFEDGGERCDFFPIEMDEGGFMEVRPSVTITPFEAVGKDSTASISVQIMGNNNNTPITLRLTKLSGTGESQFTNNSSTIQITQSGNVGIKGITESSVKDNYIIETIINNQVQTSSQSKDQFSIAKVKISRTIGTQQPTEITDMTTVTIVGERIKLNAELVPSGITLSSQLWTIPNTIVKDFQVTMNNQTGMKVAVDPLNTPTTNFVWVDGGGANLEDFVSKQVDYKAVINGYEITGKSTFQVKRPKVSLETITTETNILPNTNGMDQLIFATSIANGITFRNTTSPMIPSSFGGTTQWVQVVNRSDVTVTFSNGTTMSDNQSGLDGCYPFQTRGRGITFDSPFVGLTNVVDASVNSSFTMWLMYNPNHLQDGVWVPLMKVDWIWTAEAQLVAGQWNFLGNNSENPSFVNTPVFPEWTRIVVSADPCPIP